MLFCKFNMVYSDWCHEFYALWFVNVLWLIIDRKRQDFSKFTILLNNMRLMAILDWWEAVKDFIMINIDNPSGG